MNIRLKILAIATCAASQAMAGGLEKTPANTSVIFEEGHYLEVSLSMVKPDVDGTATVPTPGGPMTFESGNVGKDILNIGAAYKADVNSEWSYALIYDQPYAADIAYTKLPYPGAPSSAEVTSHALTAIIKNKVSQDVSIFGGLRATSSQGELIANPPFPSAGGQSYSIDIERELGWNYVLGAAFEKPEIALRASLTYTSETDFSFDTTESSVLGADRQSKTDVTMPQTVTLDFQSGIAKDTLAFAEVRWAEWSEGTIDPVDFKSIEPEGRPLVDFKGDRWNYTIGLGYRLNNSWSIATSVVHEPSINEAMGNLSPRDGFTSYGLGVSYKAGQLNVKTGLQYVEIGDTTTEALGAEFTDNNALVMGAKLGWKL